MNDTVHVKIQVVKFIVIRIWLAGVHRYLYTIHLGALEIEQPINSVTKDMT